MIGLDTNVLVRYLVRDDPQQTVIATRTISSLSDTERGFISLVTAVETYWVLKQTYRFPREQCVAGLQRLVGARELVFEQSTAVRGALEEARHGHDFADALIDHAGRSAGCLKTVTFDRRAARLTGFELLG